MGAYLDVALKAQALNDRYTAMYTLINKEWPLWSVGNRDSILDFTTAQEDMPYMKMKQHVRSVVVPDSVFDLTYLDLVEGGERYMRITIIRPNRQAAGTEIILTS